jgi:hypothetical protein
MVEVGGSMVEVGCGESTTRASYGAQMHQINKLWGASASRCGAMMHGQERDSISVGASLFSQCVSAVCANMLAS